MAVKGKEKPTGERTTNKPVVRPPRPSLKAQLSGALVESAQEHQANIQNTFHETNNQIARYIQVSQIDPSPFQNRLVFDNDYIRTLAATIDEQGGLISPIEVRPKDGNRYELVVGECRLRAHKLLGKTVIMAQVSNLSDKESSARAMIENNARKSTTDYETYVGIKRHRDRFGAAANDHEELGISRTDYFRQMSFDILPESVHSMLAASPDLLTGYAVDRMKTLQKEWVETKKADPVQIEKAIKRVVQDAINSGQKRIKNLAAAVEALLNPKSFQAKPKALEIEPGKSIGTMVQSGNFLQVKVKNERMTEEKIQKLEKFLLELCAD